MRRSLWLPVVGEKAVKIGVLALQGDFTRHIEVLKHLGVQAVPVRTPEEIERIDGLVIPGGESTTIGRLMDRFGVDTAIIRRVRDGMPVFGTCAGMILLSSEVEGSNQPVLRLINMTVRRNAFGRQIDSFETDLHVADVGDTPVRAVFIRAPIVTDVKNDVRVLAALEDGRAVLVREGSCLAAAFHPELTTDNRIHNYFISMVEECRVGTAQIN